MFGLVSFKENHGYRNSSRSVPLKAIDIQVSIHGFIANIQSVLHYFNDGDNNTETEFVFPLKTDSAVYKFEAKIDGRTIVADVCDKSQAKMIYKDAVSSGHTAMYMAEDDEAGDVFRLRLGNLPAKAAAKLTFAYVQELELNADQTGTFTLPSVLNPRYIPDCTPAEGSNGEESQEEDQETTILRSDVDVAYFSDFSITLNAEIAGGENMKVFENKLEFDVFSGAMEKAMTSTKQLKHGSDFLLLLYYKGFNSPRAIIEKGNKDEQNAFMSSDVMMVNFSPEFKDIETEIPCEFVFIIDRSGSMHREDRINKAKEALLLLLKSLPVDCLFNVVSFGSDFSFLFPMSQQYNEENLEEALNLQKKMDADMGGTEIYKPLEEVFRTEPINSYARQIFLLTDGQVSNVSKIVDLVRRQKNTRVFTFGIGYGCSSDLVTKVARASQGKATFVRDNERLQSKNMSALKCSLQRALTNVSLSWSLPKRCTVINSPEEVSGVFQGEKLILYAIISGEIPEDYSSGTCLKMLWKAGENSNEYSVDFDMNLSSSKNTNDNSYPLHRLAAKTKLSEMEMDRSDEGIMVALSTALNVTCKYTAFVGVDKTKRETQSRGQDKDSSCKTEVSESLDDDSSLKLSDLDLSMTKSSSLPGLGRRFANFCASLLPSRSKKTKSRKSSHTRSKERIFYCISSRPKKGLRCAFLVPRSTGPQSSHGSSWMNSESISNNLLGDLSMRAAQVDATMCSGSFSDESQDESEDDCASISALRRDLDLRKDESPSRMIQLIERQKFNGSWSLDDCLSQIILNKPLDEMKISSVIKDTDVWATALAIAFLNKKFAAQKNEWEKIEQKAMKWLKTKDMEGKDIIQEAVTFLSA